MVKLLHIMRSVGLSIYLSCGLERCKNVCFLVITVTSSGPSEPALSFFLFCVNVHVSYSIFDLVFGLTWLNCYIRGQLIWFLGGMEIGKIFCFLVSTVTRTGPST